MVAMFLVVAGEVNGVRGLIRLPHKTPPATPTRTVVVTIKDADLPMEPPPSLTFAPSLPIAPEPVKSISRWERHTIWPALVWCGVTVLLLGRILVAQAMTVAFRLPRRRNRDSEMNSRVARIAELFRIRRRVVIANSARAIAPFTFGVWRPVIVLPFNFKETFTPEQQDAALTHELAHVARFDSAWHAFSNFVCALLWWNPFAWLAKRELDHASELVADESSLLLADGPNRLAECLVACAKQTRRPTAVAWLGMDGGGFRSSLGQRVARLLELNPRQSATVRVPWYLRFVAPILCVGVLWLGMVAMKSGQQRSGSWRTSILGSAFAAAAETQPAIQPANTTRIEVARLVQDGKLLYETGRLEAAQTNLIKALRIDPTNKAAAYYLDLILTRKYTAESREHISQGQQEIYGKLRGIRLSEWGPIDNVPLSEVIRDLNEAARKVDPEQKGVSFFISPKANERGHARRLIGEFEANDFLPKQMSFGAMRVRLMTTLKDITLEQALNVLKAITDQKIDYSIEDYGVVISPRATEREPLHTRFFKLDPNFFRNATNAPSQAGRATNEAGGISPEATVIPTTVQNWFLSLGVDLTQKDKAGFFNDRLGVLMVRATLQDLSAVETALQQPGLQPIRPRFEKAPTETAPRSPEARETNAPASANPQTNAPVLHTRSFKVDPNTFQQGLQNTMAYDLKSGRGRHLPEFDRGTNGVIPALQALFKAAGADLATDGKAIFFNDTRGILMVRATLQDLDTMEKAIQMLNMSPPQLTIRVKVVELSKEDARGLGFDWYLGNTLFTNSVPAPSATNVVAPASAFLKLAPITNATPSSVPQSASITGVLTEDQFRFVTRALEQRDGTDVLSAAEVTTLSGRQAQISVVDKRPFITGLNTNGAVLATNKGVTTSDDKRYLVEELDIGPVVDVVPYVLPDGYTIHVNVLPSLREFLGYDTDPIWATGGPFATPPPGMSITPKFRLRTVATSARVWDGQTVVVSPDPARRIMETRQVNGGPRTTNYTDKALLFFITPRLIDPAGNPIHSDEELRELYKKPDQKQIPQH